MREHLHPVAHIRAELNVWFDVGEPVPGAYLYRWYIDPDLREEEERLIAIGGLPAVGTALHRHAASSASRGGGHLRPPGCIRGRSACTWRPRRRA